MKAVSKRVQARAQASKVSQGYLKAAQKVRRIQATSSSFKFRMAAIAAANLTISSKFWN